MVRRAMASEAATHLIVPQRLLLHDVHTRHVYRLLLPAARGVVCAVLAAVGASQAPQEGTRAPRDAR